MAVINDTSELTVDVDFNECGEEARLDLLNRLVRLYEHPGTKLKLTLAFGDPDDLFDAKHEISTTLRHRHPDIKVKYSTKLKDTDTVEREEDHAATPMERAIERLRPKAGEGIESVTLSAGGRSVELRAKTS